MQLECLGLWTMRVLRVHLAACRRKCLSTDPSFHWGRSRACTARLCKHTAHTCRRIRSANSVRHIGTKVWEVFVEHFQKFQSNCSNLTLLAFCHHTESAHLKHDRLYVLGAPNINKRAEHSSYRHRGAVA